MGKTKDEQRSDLTAQVPNDASGPDWTRVELDLRRRLGQPEGPFSVRQFTGGLANLTYLLTFGSLRFVLRRPPPGPLAPGSHDMRREYNALLGLSEVFDKAPRVYLFCDDPTIAGAEFILMEFREGITLLDGIPSAYNGQESLGLRLASAVIRTVADLHTIDPEQCGLRGLGRPDGFLERQVRNWSKRWKLARPSSAPSLIDDLAVRLARSVPLTQRTSVLHNDLHFGNFKFSDTNPDNVTALLDWDMCTLGDPLVDLGTLLAYWWDESDLPSASPHQRSSELPVPTRIDVARAYESFTNLDLSDLGWYQSFARWRIAIILQQLFNRSSNKSDSKVKAVRSLAKEVPLLAESARALLDGDRWHQIDDTWRADVILPTPVETLP
jgi:aminoglycoside phosphotransferase (APT) family kinase protein